MGFLLRRLDDNGSHCFSEISTSSDKKSLSFPHDVHAPFPESNHTVVGYCQGLFCLEYDNGKIILWNPATTEFKILPRSDMKLFSQPHCKAHVISRIRGLGFDPASGDYKVVRFVTVFYVNSSSDDINEFDQGVAKRAEVYSLKGDCWKEINNIVPHRMFEDCDIIDEYAICINGVCFWKGVRGCFMKEAILIRLDLAADDRFSTKPYPERTDHIRRDGSLVMDFDGVLGLIMYEASETDKDLCYWAAFGPHKWAKLPLQHTVRAERPLGYCTAELLLLEGYDTKLLVYDTATQELNKIQHIFDHPCTMQLFPYVETTISLQTFQISPTPTSTPTLCIFGVKKCIEWMTMEWNKKKEIREWITRERKRKRKKRRRRGKKTRLHAWMTMEWLLNL